MTTDIMDAEHPGETRTDEGFSDSEEARERYNQKVRYAARLQIEAAQDHAAVRDALLDGGGDVQAAIRKHDPDRLEELHDLGLTAFQGLSAEKVAQRYLDD